MNNAFKKLCMVAVALLAMVGSFSTAEAKVEEAQLLRFNPDEDLKTRYMLQLIMNGEQVSPGLKDEIVWGEFAIGSVYEDVVEYSGPGLNRNQINFYTYRVRALDSLLGRDRVDARFGDDGWSNFNLDGGGSGDGGGGGGGTLGFGDDFIKNLGLPPSDPGMGAGSGPMQGGGEGGGGGDGDGGGFAGGISDSIDLDSVTVNNIEYVMNKQGEVLDVGGLELLRKVSRNRLVADDETDRNYIDLNISHVFEWTHLLYLPDYPVYNDNIWFHSFPIHVPGLPENEPIMTKFMYKLIDYTQINGRNLAIIDMSGVSEWNKEWEERTSEELTEFKSWGNIGISSRYYFDIDRGVVFGIEKPPHRHSVTNAVDQPVGAPYPFDGVFGVRFPGLIVMMEFFYHTRVTDISGRPRLMEIEPKELRRYIVFNILAQLEAE
ncbi:MAG: hypothetical protein R3F46_04710 [bacterium]